MQILLKDTPKYSWHRLARNPDRLRDTGPTEFYASWSWDNVTNTRQISTRDDMQSPIYRVTGSLRTINYLNTLVVE